MLGCKGALEFHSIEHALAMLMAGPNCEGSLGHLVDYCHSTKSQKSTTSHLLDHLDSPQPINLSENCPPLALHFGLHSVRLS